jgi:hypothetical protein
MPQVEKFLQSYFTISKVSIRALRGDKGKKEEKECIRDII